MTLQRTFFILITLQLIVSFGCGVRDDPSTDVPDKTGFITGSTDSRKISDQNSTDSSNDDSESEYYSSEELDNQWDGNLDYVNKTIDKKSYKEYMIDPKGPGNSAIKVKLEQMGEPIIYVKQIESEGGSKTVLMDTTLAKIKFKLTIENSSKQDCGKVGLKLYVYDKSDNRIIDKEQSLFYKDISAGKFITKEILIDGFNAQENKRTKSFDVNFSKVELFVTNTKFYFN